MKKLLTLIAAMIMCEAYGAEKLIWVIDETATTNTCTDGGNITKPSNPTKSGYRFIGWKRGSGTDLAKVCATASSPTSENSSAPWSATFPYGTISGTSGCSSSQDTYESSSSGVNCFFKITFSDPTNGMLKRNEWIYSGFFVSASECKTGCSYYVGRNMRESAKKFVRQRMVNYTYPY